MRVTQYVIRTVVFLCIVLDPSDGGQGILIGVVLGAVIGFAVLGIRFLALAKSTDDSDLE